MIQLTEAAVDALRTAIAGSEEPVEGLRLMVESGGCAGLKYMMGLVGEAEPSDVLVEQAGIKVFVDPMSIAYLEGTTVDFVTSLEGAGFTFDNPKATWSCSCGKSFG
ncbi:MULTISPECIES: HesB/IscA family protein [Hyphomicrobiales]|uniref:Iron-sulfur cluster assembly protein n=1 Tax=Rhodopseudomonas julia TaxID=200617 RepID=A0ABU0C988_9BRAD|nr:MULTISPECIES: iron-sulfur cluster assembly accessory protein [Hyphomicrobiales]MCF1503367.1 iron-sulfur cluster assembly accessory protein [Afifella sp. H1R]MCT8267410.1 iron-sulfur cluster assembly accessory protein [Afifella sp. JA880]MDQ0326738.1 iron-sulfur cluster assembly protein [Rhodopseudomonas julia]